MASPERSIVNYCGTSDKRTCIYCWNDSNISRGMWSDSLCIEDHQNLIDRGWRSTRGTAKASVDNPDQEVRGARGTSNSNKSEFTPDPASHSPPKLDAEPSKPIIRKEINIPLERKKLRDLEPAQRTSDKERTATKRLTGSFKQEKTLTEFLQEPEKAENCVHKLEVRLLVPSLQNEEFRKSEKESFELFQQYRTEVHKNPPHLCDRDYWLLSLVHSPLKAEKNYGCPSVRYGSFHQHYILDGKLIAVSVIDILPRGLSSMYCYYLPEYKFLSIGIYTALREIAFTQELNTRVPDVMFFYTGNYIHSCPKVACKMRFSPSYLLCPETYTWIPIAECLPKLDVSKYSRLAAEGVADDEEKQDIDTIPVIYRSETMSYRSYKSHLAKTQGDDEVLEYAILVGRCAQRMVLIRDQ